MREIEAPRILFVADKASSGPIAKDLGGALARRGYASVMAGSSLDGATTIATGTIDVVVLALPLEEEGGRAAIERLRTAAGGVPFIVLGGDHEVTGGAEAFELGAQEHLSNPVADVSEFLATVGVLLGSRRGDRHLQYLHTKDAPGDWDSVIGASPGLMKVLNILKQVCSRTLTGGTPTILFQGETGTGKGFLAKCVHYNGVRRNRPYVEVNCAALPQSLMESELFGHERGAFTDAKAARAGLFETADGGTLFLDEIGSVAPDLQAKLLTAIEEKVVRRIGARRSARVDVQIVAATHEDLRARVRQGTFREDLYHRLNVVSVTIPPLRERGADVVLLAEGFLKKLCQEYGMPPRRLDEGARAFLRSYAWPGNVRELRNQMERIVILENENVVRAQHFASSSEASDKILKTLPPSGGKLRVSLPPNGLSLTALEREVIKEALEWCEGNISKTARYLSISRQTLMYRMKKHRLE